MSLGHTSHSQIRRFEQCPKSFELHYRKRLPAEESELAAFGKVVHAACEGVVREHVSAGGTGVLSAERARHHDDQAWRASSLSGLALYQEGAQMLAVFVRDQGPLDGPMLRAELEAPATRMVSPRFTATADRTP